MNYKKYGIGEREFEFRAWHFRHKKMFKVEKLKLEDGEWENNKQLQEPIDYIYDDTSFLMQYTGLKDKNGKKIFEGDILKCDGSTVFSNQNCKEGRISFAVRTLAGFSLCDGEFDVKYPSSANTINNYEFWNSADISWEVIGNVFESALQGAEGEIVE